MRGKTTYHVCLEEADYLRCEALRAAEHEDLFARHFPMAYALRDGLIVGYLGTYEDGDDMVVGPLVLATNDRGGPFYAVQLLRMIHAVFARCGVTGYLVAGNASRREYCALLECLGFQFLQEYCGNKWYALDMARQAFLSHGEVVHE